MSAPEAWERIMRLFNTALAATLLVAGATPSFAEYPDHAIQIVVPYTPGGTVDRTKPQWEFPRLCRGGSKSLTYPAVDTVGPSTKLRIVSSQAHEEEFHRWMTMKV
jgi:hypothetical protein